MHNRNTNARVNLFAKLPSRIKRCFVIVLNCETRLYRIRQTMKIATEVTNRKLFIIVVRSYVNVDFSLRCFGQAHKVKDLTVYLKVFDSV